MCNSILHFHRQRVLQYHLPIGTVNTIDSRPVPPFPTVFIHPAVGHQGCIGHHPGDPRAAHFIGRFLLRHQCRGPGFFLFQIGIPVGRIQVSCLFIQDTRQGIGSLLRYPLLGMHFPGDRISHTQAGAHAFQCAPFNGNLPGFLRHASFNAPPVQEILCFFVIPACIDPCFFNDGGKINMSDPGEQAASPQLYIRDLRFIGNKTVNIPDPVRHLILAGLPGAVAAKGGRRGQVYRQEDGDHKAQVCSFVCFQAGFRHLVHCQTLHIQSPHRRGRAAFTANYRHDLFPR